MRNYEELRCWKAAHTLTLNVYRETSKFPSDERLGLSAQIRRACVSIGSNIAEGAGRSTDADFARFLDIAIGSCSEVHYQLRISADLNYIHQSTFESLGDNANHVRRSLFNLTTALRQTRATS
jgi:four helix bundle protein